MEATVRRHLAAQAEMVLKLLADIERFGEDAYSVSDPNETYGDLLRHVVHAMVETLEQARAQAG
ncbi:MAG: hypothetical protein K6U14_11435 [Firmicutes bacterium]|nr:hypothetical protein [Alicyclobacillaceae bacterium]MCL6498226.1 hypothetical protein [Bacillota bacterium]